MTNKSKAFIILGNQLFPLSYLKHFKDHHIMLAEDYQLCTYVKHHRQKILLFFSYHLDCFLRTFVGADATALAEPEIDIEILINCGIRAVHGAQSAGIAFLTVNYGFEYPPGSCLACSALFRTAHS